MARLVSSVTEEPRGALASDLGPTVRFLPSTAVELLLSVMPIADPDGRNRMTDGEAWAARAASLPARERKTLVALGKEPLINLMGLATEGRGAHDAGQLLERMHRLSSVELVLHMVGGYRRTVRRLTPPDVIRAAVEGDRAARREFRETSMPDVDFWQATLGFVLSRPADEIATRALTAFDAWYAQAVQPEEPMLARAQADQLARLSAEQSSWTLEAAMGRVTLGMEYQPPAGVDDVIFVPVSTIRPLIAFLDHRNAAVVAFPITEPGAAGDPPANLVLLGKALGDELRLRALRALAAGPSTLQDLAAELGVPRTTLGHHIGMLRAAGLVTMTVDDGRWGRLKLRIGVADELPRMLRDYTTGR
ncbi:MAG TPA: winged helix-turn-helix domain-containing protein [Candidatus Limnocylindria bacterium]